MAGIVELVYARALLEAVVGDAGVVDDELRRIVEAIEADEQTWQLLTAPTLPASEKTAMLERATEGAHVCTRNLLRVLVDRRRLGLLPDVARAFHVLAQGAEGRLDVTVTTAVELPGELRDRLQDRLSDSTGKNVRLHASIDPRIIGGLVVQHGDTLVDASLRGRLEQLRLRMTHGT